MGKKGPVYERILSLNQGLSKDVFLKSNTRGSFEAVFEELVTVFWPLPEGN